MLTDLEKYGFEIQRVFRDVRNNIFLELLCMNTIETILVRISPKYEIQLPPNIIEQSIEEIPHPKNTDITLESETFIENMYSSNELLDNMTNRGKSIVDTYKKQIVVDNEKTQQLNKLNIIRQLNRLKYCVSGLSYRLGIISNNLLCILNKKEEIVLYQMKGESPAFEKIYIVVNFGLFYDKISTIEKECSQIITGIYNILNINQNIHTKNVNQMLEQKESISEKSNILKLKKEEYIQYIDKYLELLYQINKSKQDKNFELIQLKKVNHSINLHHDMKRTHQIKKIEKDLSGIEKTRNEIIKIIKELKVKYEKLSIDLDTIMFNNLILLDNILKNIEHIHSIN